MKHYILNGKKMTDKISAHEHISGVMAFPDYYGKNLDALWDMLTQMTEPVKIILENPSALSAMGEYGEKLIDTFKEAQEENENVIFVVGR